MKIGILTTLSNYDPAYSLATVIWSQLTALIKYGYEVVLFTHDNFTDDSKVPKGVEIRKIVPRFLLIDYGGNQEISSDFSQQVNKAYEAIRDNTKDIDIIIEHDLIFQGWFLPYCVAIHKLADETNIKWFHWIHSLPNAKPSGLSYPHSLRYTLPKNSKLVYLNNYNIIRAAEAYGLFPKDVRIVYNPLDPRLFYNLHPLVHSIIDRYDILSSDFIQTYPLSTPRMVAGKGLHMVIDIFGKLKSHGKKVSLIVCNAHANDRREKQLISETLSYATTRGLNASEVIFTSLEDTPKYELGVQREVVSQLFNLSNLFIFPSISENCSLILLEAMLAKNLLILNDDVGSMREFGKDNALYFKFGSIENTIEYSDKENYMNDVAKIIISEMSTNKALKGSVDIKQHYTIDAIFKKMIEPLFFEQ